MDRRHLLALLGGSVSFGLGGCAGSSSLAPDRDAESDGNTPTPPAVVTGADGTPSDICTFDARPERIPAIVEPVFAPSWDGVSGASGLDDGTPVVGLNRDGKTRAYPLPVLRLEIVNDTMDVPLLVTYCPLCDSGLTAKREVNGEPSIFGNTGFTWQPPSAAGQAAIDEKRPFGIAYKDQPSTVSPTNDPNLVMFDTATGSYWSQLLAQAICGPQTARRLELIPSTVTTWGAWRDDNPDTTVLLPPPHSTTMRS